MKDMQRAQIEWAKKRQEQLNYIDNEIMKEHEAEKRFTDINWLSARKKFKGGKRQ